MKQMTETYSHSDDEFHHYVILDKGINLNNTFDKI